MQDSSPLAGMIEMEIWGRSQTPIGDPAFTADGRLVVSHHPAFKTGPRLSVFTAPDRLEPYPDAHWNRGGGAEDAFDSPQGLRTDSRGVMWIADLGQRAQDATPKIVGWNTQERRLERILLMPPPLTHRHSEPQDVLVDERRGKLYVADEGAGAGGDGSQAALIVLDIASGEGRRVLHGAACVTPQDVDIVVDRRVVQSFDEETGVSRNTRVGVDGIALDHAAEWLYFGPLNGDRLYRIRAEDLNDVRLSDAELAARVEDYAGRPNAGGMWIDAADNIYLVEIEARAVGVIPASDRTYRRLAEHPLAYWPDGLVGGPDGYIYVTATQLPSAPAFNGGAMAGEAPYLVLRLQPPAGLL